MVRSRAADDVVAPIPAIDPISLATTVDHVASIAAVDRIAAGSTVDGVPPPIAVQDVVPGAAVDRISAMAAADEVIPIAAKESVVVMAANEGVIKPRPDYALKIVDRVIDWSRNGLRSQVDGNGSRAMRKIHNVIVGKASIQRVDPVAA